MRKYIFFLFIIQVLCTLSVSDQSRRDYIIILDPAGDAKRTGRKIADSFERGLALQCAEKIKEVIEHQTSHIKVIITRMPGDTVYDLQNASLSNRLNADLFINLNFYYCQDTKPVLFLYQFSYGTNFACEPGLAFHTYDQAYIINQNCTNERSQEFKQLLMQQKYQSLFSVVGVHQLPIKPLIGIVAPSIAIEAGLKNKDAWMHYVDPLAQAIVAILK